ncbi:MAG: xanthine dehydrogenase family protein molybdopterin-binding subunit [Candidatus Binatia bacterium]
MKSVGRAIPGLTNRTLVSGRGNYVGDLQLPGMCAMAVLRSPYAHARIAAIDTAQAAALPGVLAVVTGADAQRETSPIPSVVDPAMYGGKAVALYALAVDRARYVGEPVAAVVAEDRYTAHRALELIEVTWEELPAVIDPEAGLQPGAPLVEPEWGDNVMIHREFVRGNPAGALAEADGVVRGAVKAHRYVAAPMEPRAYAGIYDAFKGEYTVWSSTQNPHPLRYCLSGALRVQEADVHVVQPHVGGGFGEKTPTFQEEVLVPWLARKLERPVKFVEERTEHFLAGGHAREERLEFEAGYRKDGRVTGLTVRLVADVGAPASFCGWAMSYVSAYCIPTAYKIDDCRIELFTVATNKCPWNGYRAFGKEASSFLMDRIMDRVADATGLDRWDVRLKNFIQPDEFPYPQVSGAVLDSGDYPKALRGLLDMIDVPAFRKEQEAARRQGRYLGLGIGFELTPEGCSLPQSAMCAGYDGSTVRVAPSGQVTVLTGVTSPGSGNETGIAQIVADVLGVPMDQVRVIQGDTETCPFGLGNYSSRSLMIGGSAAQIAATELREKMFNVAAKALEVTPADLDAEDGRIYVKGAPSRHIPFKEVASLIYRHAYGREASGVEPGLESTRYFRIGNVHHRPEVDGRLSPYPTWPYGAAAAVVEVDTETGVVKVLNYAILHDSGPIINPLLAEGNLLGGVAQGLGAALYENMVYDEAGQLKTATFMDYTIPTAVEMPPCVIGHQSTPSPFTPMGMKGVGESGVTAPLGAIPSAIEDALSHLKLELMETPLTPDRIWRAIRAASANS